MKPFVMIKFEGLGKSLINGFCTGQNELLHVLRIYLVGHVVRQNEKLRLPNDLLLDPKPPDDKIGDDLHEPSQSFGLVIYRSVKPIISQNKTGNFRRPHGD